MDIKKSKLNLNMILGKPYSLSEKFHSKTKIKRLQKSPLPESKWPLEWKTVFFKEYPRLDKIILPQALSLEKVNLESVFFKRTSQRNFSKVPLSIEELSTLLLFSAGIKDSLVTRQQTNRFYASPGARYPLEVYLISLNSDIPEGFYHYNVRGHCLEILDKLKKIDLNEYFDQLWIKKCGALVLFSAVFERTTNKYGDRGYRHILNEAGALTQNLYLISAALNLSICGIGGYVDDKLNTYLDLDGIKESIIQVTAIGKSVK